VCGSSHHNTSDKNYLLFTKDAGMVFASARSVREERSKQRYALQDFSHIRISLLKGKHGWRIGSVESFGNPFLRAESRAERGYINFLVGALRRYVHGEIPVPRAYTDLEWIFEHPQLLQESGIRIQQLFLLRLLSELGYIAPEALWEGLLSASTLSDASAAYTSTMEGAIERAIKAGIQASHL
jgi:recombinational DNA repair protein (RecF pathway)